MWRLSALSWRNRVLLVMVLAALPLFFVGGPPWHAPPLYRALWDLGHILFFAVLLFWFQGVRPLTRWPQWLLALTLVFLAGGAIELLQARFGRDASWDDVFNNLLGAALGLFWGIPQRLSVSVARLLVALLLLIPVSGIFRLAWVQWQSAQAFPLLASFETSHDMLRWEGDIVRVREHARHGDYALRVTLGTEENARVSYDWYASDWRGYHWLKVDIYNPDDEHLPLMLRLHDLAHDQGDMEHDDRYNQALVIEPGWNHLAIPLDAVRQGPRGREMNMHQVRALVLFSISLPREREFYLDHLRLE